MNLEILKSCHLGHLFQNVLSNTPEKGGGRQDSYLELEKGGGGRQDSYLELEKGGGGRQEQEEASDLEALKLEQARIQSEASLAAEDAIRVLGRHPSMSPGRHPSMSPPREFHDDRGLMSPHHDPSYPTPPTPTMLEVSDSMMEEEEVETLTHHDCSDETLYYQSNDYFDVDFVAQDIEGVDFDDPNPNPNPNPNSNWI